MVQAGHGGRLFAQSGDLAEHVEAVGFLVVIADGLKCRARGERAVEPLGRDPEAADVQAFEGVADSLGGEPFGVEAGPFLLEPACEGRGADADLMTGAGLEQDGRFAAEDFILEARNDGTGRDGLLGEKIRGADQDSDFCAASGERAGECRDERSGASIVDAAGKDEANGLSGYAAVEGFGDRGEGLLPENETGPGPHVATAFAALEDEAAGSVAEVLVEQAGGRRVQIGDDAVALEGTGLVGSPAGDQGKRGFDGANRGKLLGA